MNGNRGAKGSIKDRLISMLYRMRYKKKKLKEEDYTIESKEKQVNYLNNLTDFKEQENINILDTKDKTALDNVNYTANFNISPKKSFFDNIPVQEKQVSHEHVYVDKTGMENKITTQTDNVIIENMAAVPKISEIVDIKLTGIESKTSELTEQVDLKKEVKKG